MGSIETKSVQCVLTANLINEKIFTSLWWWLQFLTVITVINAIQWLFRLWNSHSRRSFLEQTLKPATELVLPTAEDFPADESVKSGETNEESLNTDSCDDSGVRSSSPMPATESDVTRHSISEHRCAYDEKIRMELRNFEKFVGADGILIFRLIESTAGEFFASNVIGKVFLRFNPESVK